MSLVTKERKSEEKRKGKKGNETTNEPLNTFQQVQYRLLAYIIV